MKKIILLFIFMYLTTSSLFAINESEIDSTINKTTDNIIKVVLNKELEKQKKYDLIEKNLSIIFDYNTMAKIVLSKKYKKLSKDMKDRFVLAFTNKLKDSYSSKLDMYKGEPIVISKFKKTKSTRGTITITLKLTGSDVVFIYKLYRKRNTKEWFIYDFVIENISIVQTYRKQFQGFLKTKTMEELIVKLNTKED